MDKVTYKHCGRLSKKSITRIRASLIRRNKLSPDGGEKKDA